ncbi:MAG: hypothetical protein ACTSQK_06115 [Candidatus Heimdallarchaeota archaeon]
MDSINKKTILTLWVLGLFSLTMIVVPSMNGTTNIFENNDYSTKTIGAFVEDFEDTTFMDGSTTAFGWGTGAITSDRNFSVELLDFYGTINPVVDVDVEGQKAYTTYYNEASFPESIGCYMVIDPYDIRLCSERVSWSSVLCLAADGDVLYTGKGGAIPGISTYYVTDAFNLQSGVGVYQTVTFADGAVTDIELNGHLAYYTAFNSASGYSLRVLYAEDPSAPTNITASWMDSSKALGLAVEGNFAFVAAAEDGLYVVNVSDKNNFLTVGSIDTSGNATDVIVDGRFAYLAAGDEGIFTIDLIDKSNPEIVGHYDTPGYARKLVLQGNTLFVADGGEGITVLDVADPANPTFVTSTDLGSYVYDVDLFGGTLVAGSEDGLHTLTIQSMEGIADIAHTSYENSYTDKQAWDVRVRGDIAYVAGGPDGFYTLDVRDPNNPILLDNYSVPISYSFTSIDIDGDLAHLIDSNYWYIFDISNPSDIKFLNLGTTSNINDVYAHGDIAFIALQGTVNIINCTDPLNWATIDTLTIGTNITSVWVEGKYLYAGEYTDGSTKPIIWIYDITDLTAPVFVGDVTEKSMVTDMYIDGDICYVSHETWSLTVNITDPTNPFYADWTSPASIGTWGFGPYQLSANPSGSVDLINATNIEVTSRPYFNTDASSAWRVTTNGDFTYVANQTSLVILRHFLSAGDTYNSGTTLAQSLEIDSTEDLIYRATLNPDVYLPLPSNVDYFMSADGGAHWEAVTPGVEHIFANTGNDLCWRAEIYGPEDRSVHLYEVSIDYFYNEQPTAPQLNDPGVLSEVSSVALDWNASTDDIGIDHYELQVAIESSFATPMNTFNVTGLTQTVTGLTNGTYYFRVRAVDDYNLTGDWSATVDIEVEIPAIDLPWWSYVIIGGVLVAIILAVVITLVVRKKKIATR